MSAPERIYRTNPNYDSEEPEGAEYIRADIHEAEIDVTQTALRLMNKTAEIMSKEIDALKAELAALKAPPKVLSAEEIKWSGVYRWRDSEDAFQWDWVSVCEFRVDGKREFDMFRFGDNKIEKAWGQFIGPIKMPEVSKTELPTLRAQAIEAGNAPNLGWHEDDL